MTSPSLEDELSPKSPDSPYSKYFLQLSPIIDKERFYSDNALTRILRKEQRTPDETLHLYKQLKVFRFYKKFPKEHPHIRFVEALICLTQSLKYEYYKAGTVVYKKGDYSNQKAYLIYTGEVVICTDQHVENKSHRLMRSFPENRSKNAESIQFETRAIIDNSPVENQTYREDEAVTHKFFELLPVTDTFSTPEFTKIQTKRDQIPITSAFDCGSAYTPQTPSTRLVDLISEYCSEQQSQTNRITHHHVKAASSHYIEKMHMYRSDVLTDNNRLTKSEVLEASSSHYLPTLSNKSPGLDATCLSFGDSIGEDKPVKPRRKLLDQGRHFGDKTLGSKDIREETVIAKTDCVLLTFTEEDYKYIMNRYNLNNTSIINFLFDCIPGLEKAFKYKKLEYLKPFFEQQTFPLSGTIITEKTKGDTVYLLYKGFCEVIKEIKEPRTLNIASFTPKRRQSQPKYMAICVLRPGLFFGDELLFNESEEYSYTVKAASGNTKVFGIKAGTFKNIMPKDVLNQLERLYLNKKRNNEKLLHNKIQTSLQFQKLSPPPLQKAPEQIIQPPDDLTKSYYIMGKTGVFRRKVISFSETSHSFDKTKVCSMDDAPNCLEIETGTPRQDIRQHTQITSIKSARNQSESISIQPLDGRVLIKNKPDLKRMIQGKFQVKNFFVKKPHNLGFDRKDQEKEVAGMLKDKMYENLLKARNIYQGVHKKQSELTSVFRTKIQKPQVESQRRTFSQKNRSCKELDSLESENQSYQKISNISISTRNNFNANKFQNFQIHNKDIRENNSYQDYYKGIHGRGTQSREDIQLAGVSSGFKKITSMLRKISQEPGQNKGSVREISSGR